MKIINKSKKSLRRKKHPINMTSKEVMESFNSSLSGLNEKQVTINRQKYGINEIIDKKRKSILEVFLEQYLNLLVIVLILASILSYFTGGVENTIVIIIVITLNAILGTFEYFKAEKSMQSLKKMASLYVKVIRDGQNITIPSTEVVCGDIVIIKSGDVIPSDMRIIECEGLEVDESMLTGESVCQLKNSLTQKKTKVISEMTNILFRGTKVIKGKGKAVVYSVGMDTEIGAIAQMISGVKKNKSPLEKNIDLFSRDLALIIITICVFVFLLSVYQGISKMESLMFAISLAVAAIPEALQTIVTICLAISTEKLAKENAVVKDINAIETLGCIDVICTDKTGTLTTSEMRLDFFFYDDKIQNNITKKTFKEALILCNDASYENINKQEKASNTDEAILNYFNYDEIVQIKRSGKKLKERPFSSEEKSSSVIYDIHNEKILYIKGAAEKIIDKCNLTIKDKEEIINVISFYTKQSYRILAIGYKKIPFVSNTILEDNLTFLGLIFLSDPIKKGVIDTIKNASKLGVRVVMITGDHAQTALAVASNVGITRTDKYLTGDMIDGDNNKDLQKKVEEVNVFARVTPYDKIRIVTLLQKNGHQVAFLGDGVNDAPALKKANVGVSMGKNGTDVSKEASDVLLLDDNLDTVVKAIKRGRKIYLNIQNAILFLIAGNIAGLFLVLYTSLLRLPMPFEPIHLLFINLINDSLPAIAIGIEENNEDTKEIAKARNITSPILSKRLTKRIFCEGLLISIFTLIAYYLGKTISESRTLVFVTITIARLCYSFNCRGRVSIIYQIRHKKKMNKILIASFIFGLTLIAMLLFIPQIRTFFAISYLPVKMVIIAVSLGLAPAVILQAFFMYRDKKRSKKK